MHLAALLVVASVLARAMSQSSASSPADCIACPPSPACNCAVDEECFIVTRNCLTCGEIRCVPANGTNVGTSNAGFSDSTASPSLPGPAKPSGSGAPSAPGNSAALHFATNPGSVFSSFGLGAPRLVLDLSLISHSFRCNADGTDAAYSGTIAAATIVSRSRGWQNANVRNQLETLTHCRRS
ncbi:hypothetical protein MVEN_00445400 [Mycena venus]|uniref:Membrane anchor Opy2 N-terminal domain-containing protein n=1 Tax=Mycena venus TaxID=2733690 RepID=A0A8H6YUY9_9AGAR|nr:hypothetical protein MVEN_00445400 [Mycena venus]